MNSNLKRWLIAILLLVVGLFVGRMIGAAEVYKKTAGTMDNRFIGVMSSNLKSHLALLELLNAGQTGQAAQTLERLLDADLLGLRRFSGEEIRKQNPDLIGLIDRATQYRQQHPSAKSGGR